MASQSYDALIVGAGPAGAATALALARRGWRIAVLDALAQPRRTVGESLHGVAQLALRELGVWESLEREQYRPSYLVRSVWGSDRVHEKDSIWHRYGPDHHLDRARFDAWLVDHAVAAGVEVIRPASVRHVVRDRRRSVWRVTARFEEQWSSLTAAYVVDATGRSARIGRSLGAQRRRLDGLVGIARWFKRPFVEPSILIEATAEGWWYSAPAPHGQALAVWFTDGPSPAARAARPEVWSACLERAPRTHARVMATGTPSAAFVCDAAPALTHWDADEPWLPVGDAAVAFDPMSGDGLCFALRSALEAAQVLDDARRGRTVMIAAYRNGIERVLRQHLQARGATYEREQRWSRAPFWAEPRGLALLGTA